MKNLTENLVSERGSIIVFAVAVITVMSITAALLTVTSIWEIRKSANIERAALARYKAESGIENGLFVLRRAFAAGKTIEDAKGYLGFTDSNNIGETVACTATAGLIKSNCERMEVKFGVADLQVQLNNDQVLSLDLYNPTSRDKPPGSNFVADKLYLSWLDPVDYQFEVSMISWKNNGLSIVPASPVRIILNDDTNFADPLDGGLNNQIAVQPILCSPPDPPSACTFEGGTPSGGDPHVLGKIRVGLINQLQVPDLRVQLYNNADNSYCDSINGYTQCIPGFVELVSTGRDSFNKQALKVVMSLPTEEEQTSDIWDYALFSHGSLTK
ncbi:MAG: hypothetical protein A2445_04555 [Candidatus Jacksonbacteria bacterium RIFOXYC2_FULL_44_29]|nr:MAG: hypothetical protein UV19_C0003G0033 [Parcubacteria group bacterium GW2011_GWA2_42_28]KKT55852.1 MAG: hypothetical protein UW45_C0004G0033 [Parcubacteria group bacterium GW2011_GWC2_44_22]OGY75630.1 MAG: hypothetical protein A2240_03745 [Candidatus Jacksonbacteria bacterium RIFOXYA2_FULL_43_12]OGY76603.1 MAG: hypothetical protein A2295_01485 [Candidatus Jacksonbacteria bacterium RIFOXYB2_FULL_44_15]OGY78328.1 MAG: hypothetical protein A2445_04555 [Candidatus Jacksonbacteria bacterium RI